ncbi:MAG: nucleotidyltransferase family protein [Candidatus Aureabacteria bacterium]|nr:nucleotidyltransferase family protein [Candidatus Auribacterota bacterium]
MKALLLAAGCGIRFGAQEATGIPKPMVRVAGKPLIERAIEHVREHGITQLYINLHYHPSAIQRYFGDGRRWGVEIHYSFEPELLGTGGAVKKLRGELDGTFLVYYADNLCSCDLTKMVFFHGEKRALATILVSERYDDLAGGVVGCDKEGRVVSFMEKPSATTSGERLENGGIYVLEPKIIDCIPGDRPCDFARDIFPELLRAGEALYCYRAEGYVRGIDTPERYRNLLEELRTGVLTVREKREEAAEQ